MREWDADESSAVGDERGDGLSGGLAELGTLAAACLCGEVKSVQPRMTLLKRLSTYKQRTVD